VFNEAAADKLARERKGENSRQSVSTKIPIDQTWLWICGSVALLIAVIKCLFDLVSLTPYGQFCRSKKILSSSFG